VGQTSRSHAGGRIGLRIRGGLLLQSMSPTRIDCGTNTYHPVCGKVEAYSADFALDRAVFRRADNGIQTETEVIVSGPR